MARKKRPFKFVIGPCFKLGIFTGNRSANLGFCGHPGVPFAIVSWLSMRAAALTYPSGVDDIISYSLQEPGLFDAASKISELLLAVSGIVMVWLFALRYDIASAIADCLVFFCVTYTTDVPPLEIGNHMILKD